MAPFPRSRCRTAERSLAHIVQDKRDLREALRARRAWGTWRAAGSCQRNVSVVLSVAGWMLWRTRMAAAGSVVANPPWARAG